MKKYVIRAFAAAALTIAATASVQAAETADMVLVNGKIVTVDDQFHIAQALAIKGQRIIAVGTTRAVMQLADHHTQKINLHGKTVIPGLIDNHAHYIRSAELWDREVRLDGVTTRKKALEMLSARVKASKPGEWIVSLGGWTHEQFTDDPRPFTRAELDRIAPDNPVVLQLVYVRDFINSAAIKALGITKDTPNPKGGKIMRDAAGEPTGVIEGGGGVGWVVKHVPEPSPEQWIANARAMVSDLNGLGITAWLDAGGRGMKAKHYEPFKALADKGELDIRTFYTTIRQPATPQEVDKVVEEIKTLTPFQGNDYFNNVGYGEQLYRKGDPLLGTRATYHPSADYFKQVARVANAVAARGLFLNVHATLNVTIDGFLTIFEQINKVHPIKGLRWTFSHLDEANAEELDRIKKLGMYAEIHSRPLDQGVMMHQAHGDRAYDMPPFRMVQDSGIHWGLGTDATAVTPANPFYTLSLAVTGRMIGGRLVNKEHITREQALIAYTRNNAYFVFEEDNIGALQPGKYADLLVLDRDYLTVPASQIKDIKPLLTMVGGKVVHQAARL